MKKLLLGALVASAATAGVYAQGLIAVDNTANGNPSSSATSGGLVFVLNSSGVATLEQNNFSVAILGGADANSMSPVITLTGANQVFNFGGGIFQDPNGGAYAVPGVPLNGTATLEILAWEGNFTSYAAAVAGGAAVGETVPFQNGTGGGGNPPATPVDLLGMPALVLATPEPTTIALGGLGAAALMLFRRRK